MNNTKNKYLINIFIPLLLVLFVLSSSSLLLAEELKAYRGLKFKQTPKEVIDVFRNDSEIRGYPIAYDDIEYHITKGEGMFQGETTLLDRKTDMLMSFYQNKLYSVAFLSKSVTADKFKTELNTVRKDYAALIKNKYGEPDFTQEINFIDVTGDYPVVSHRWNIDDKKILITTEEYESKYSVILQLIYEPLWQEKYGEEAQAKEKDIEKESGNF